MSDDIKLKIVGLIYNQTVVGTYGLVLSEEEGNRRFSIMIGESEAQSIALKLNNRKSPRPLSHDLIHDILHLFQANLKKVLIYRMSNDIFYSEIHITTAETDQILDARTSDAVALAVRSGSPIYIKAEVLDVVGSEIINPTPGEESTDDEPEIENMTDSELQELNIEELKSSLEEALEKENYEFAVRLREAIKHKTNE